MKVFDVLVAKWKGKNVKKINKKATNLQCKQ